MDNNSSSFGSSLGNPAPLGLAAFGTTTFYLMTIVMGWSESSFEDLVAANAFYYGGICQLLVGVLELFKGSSFSFLVFGSYGAFWLGFAHLHFETQDSTTLMGEEAFPIGRSFYYTQWTVLTAFFTLVATRKNTGLVLLLGLLTTTFALLAIATGLSINEETASSGATTKKVAGYFGLTTALQAYYLCFAEIINEEWGRHVLPGLTPLVNTASTAGTIGNDPDKFASKYMSYDRKSNTLMLYFRGIQIQNPDDAHTVCNAIERKILSAIAADNDNNDNTNNNIGGDTEEFANGGTASPEKKVHVIVDYRDAVIANGRVQEVYIREITDLQNRYYLSAKRFGISSFGTQTNQSDFVGISKTKLG